MTVLNEVSWHELADRLLPGVLPAEEYLTRTVAAARRAGFSSGDTLPVVATCRDELMVGFTEMVDRAWGPYFAVGALGGMVLAGRSGIAAAVGHAPDQGRRRFVLFVMPHLGIGMDGTVGVVHRPGQTEPSPACGALSMFQQEVASGELRLEYDRLDPEMSLLRTRLAPAVLRGGLPDLPALTALARDVAAADLMEIGGMTGSGRGSVAVFTGIVVHGPYGQEFVAPHAARIHGPREHGQPPEPLHW